MDFTCTRITEGIVSEVSHSDKVCQTHLPTFVSSTPDQPGWNDGSWLFPRVMRLLEVPAYRKHVLGGVVISIGSKTDSTVR